MRNWLRKKHFLLLSLSAPFLSHRWINTRRTWQPLWLHTHPPMECLKKTLETCVTWSTNTEDRSTWMEQTWTLRWAMWENGYEKKLFCLLDSCLKTWHWIQNRDWLSMLPNQSIYCNFTEITGPGAVVKNISLPLQETQETWVWSLGWEDSLE